MASARVFCWLLDVGPLLPVQFDGPPPFKSTEIWCRGQDAQRALALLSPDERTKTLRFLRHTDAKLCLGSCLLKRLAISEKCGIAWNDVVISEDANRKPCYLPTERDSKPLEFNVSHHGSLVGLVGCQSPGIQVGVDIVHINWERDNAKVQEEGFASWARTFEMVFSDREMRDIANYQPDGDLSEHNSIRAKLRHFYVHWCLKEAYVKMTGEALMASWLKQVEFRNVKVPAAASDGEWGETCDQAEVWFSDQQLSDILLSIHAFREDYMIAISVSRRNTLVDAYQVLDLAQIVPTFEQA